MTYRTAASKFVLILLAVIIGASPVAPGLADTPPAPPQLPPPDDGAQRAYHDQTGKLRFLAAQPGQAIAVPGAQEATTAEDRAMAALSLYAQEFGLSSPVQELQVMEAPASTGGPAFVRYQQIYQGVPVMAGEMIVGTDEAGNLLSMSGEVSPQPSLSVTPDIAAEQARTTALEAVAKWYELTPADLTATEPQLWVYDERLLLPSTRPIELVWRMDVTATDLQPIDELVLVNAHTGGISLHFNQIDAAWGGEPPHAYNPFMQAGGTFYVATTGNDANLCTAPASPCATINGAIGKATNGDTVKVAVGTYVGISLDVVVIDKNITLSGGWDATFTAQSGMTTIDGEDARRGILVTTTVATIERFVIQNGNADRGGGIYNYLATLTLNNSIVSGNKAGIWGGGGIRNDNTLILNNSVVTANTTASGSAGIEPAGVSLILNNSTLSNNNGIAIWSSSTTSIALNNSTIKDNNGTGISMAAGVLNINNSTISGNHGAGIAVSGTFNLNNSTISNNGAPSNGGGIYFGSGTLTISNSTISGNVAVYNGGGLYNFNGNVSTRNSIIAKNSAENGQDCYGAVNSLGYNLIGNKSGCTFNVSTGDQVGTNTAPINPHLGFLQNNGGSTFTHALLADSLTIDKGNPATPGSGGNACLATDQRNIARPTGSACDIGAFEGSTNGFSFSVLRTYSADQSTILPGNFRCSQNQLPCTNGADLDADAAHLHTLQTYDFYAYSHSRDSIDNDGMVITSTVNYGINHTNAFWNSAQMVYGDGFPLADDVVAHELTHGVTQFESNLFYYYQSGAINESFSDIWGEFVDQTNGVGNDNLAVKWLMGEDVPILGALRNMANPPAFEDPDTMTSPLFYTGNAERLYGQYNGDNGGVHTNSGVNNKAAYLMTDGGTFNGKTVTGLGIPKVAAIYYEVQTNLLTSGADYTDLYYALSQACALLVGGAQGITNDNCQTVRDAADAVEMNKSPNASYNSEAPFCPTNMSVDNTLFSDDLETGAGNWTFGVLGGSPSWSWTSRYAASGSFMLWGNDSIGPSLDTFAAMTVNATPPVGQTTFLHFKHSFGFEQYPISPFANFDGGWLEYSVNDSGSWLDAESLFSAGQDYGGSIFNSGSNPNGNHPAFVSDSHGYVSSRFDLSALAGKSIRFRWRMSTDGAVYDRGWFVDDVRIYTCVGVPSIPSLLIPAANGLTTDYTPTLDWADSTPGLDHYQLQVDDNSDFLSLLLDQTTTPSTYTFAAPLLPAKTYYWRVRAFNGAGFASDWSPARILYTAVVPPSINFPANNGPVYSTRPLFDWANVTGATSYTLQISANQNFSPLVFEMIMSPSAFTVPNDLPRNTLLFWRVRANGVHGSGDWSRTRHFDSANPPGVPVLVAPLNAAVVTLPPTLDWNDSSPAADSYEIQISTDANFATLLGRGFSGRSNQSVYVPSGAFGANTTYHWRVRAVTASGQFSQWSAARNFKTP